MASNRCPALACLVFVTALLAAGCSRGPALTEVEGMVVLNKKPLDNVQVEFLPDPDEGTTGPRSVAVTDTEGRFRLTCDNQKPGAVVGKHRVIVRDLKVYEGVPPGRDDGTPLKPSRIHAKYADSVLTPLRLEIKEGQEPVRLEVKPP